LDEDVIKRQAAGCRTTCSSNLAGCTRVVKYTCFTIFNFVKSDFMKTDWKWIIETATPFDNPFLNLSEQDHTSVCTKGIGP